MLYQSILRLPTEYLMVWKNLQSHFY